MVWIRYGRIKAIWRCYTTRGYSTKYHVVGVAIRDEYEKRPIEDIDTWARKLGDFVVDKMCTNSCESLSASVFCDKTSLEVEVIYTSETLVVKPVVKKEVEVVKEEERNKEKELEEKYIPPAIKIPKDVVLRIERIEDLIKDAGSIDEKMALEEELKKLKDRWGVK